MDNSDALFKQLAASLIRHGLTVLAGYLVAQGLLSQSGTAEFIGAMLTISAVAWSWLQKVIASEKITSLSDAVSRVIPLLAAINHPSATGAAVTLRAAVNAAIPCNGPPAKPGVITSITKAP